MATTGDKEIPDGAPYGEFATDVGYLRQFLEGLESVRNEGKLVITEDAVYSKVVDPSNVMMCLARIQGRALNGLSVDGGSEVLIGGRFERLIRLLQGTSKNSEVEFSFPILDGGANSVHLHIVDEEIEFYTPALDPDSVPKMPQSEPLTHNTQVVLPGTDLKKAINHAEKTIDPEAGSVAFKTYGGVFEVESRDKVEGSFSKKFRQSGPTESGELGEHETEIGYGFLDDIKKVLGRSDEVTVHIKDSNPLRFDVMLDDEGDAQLIYIIAPRIEKQ